MGTELIYNESDTPVELSYDGRTVVIQPRHNGKWARERFGVTNEPAPEADIAAGLFYEDPDSLERLRVVPVDQYTKKLYRLVKYGEDDKAVKRKLPQYCSIFRKVSDAPQDGCTLVSSALAEFACSGSFQRLHGVKLRRGAEVTAAFREKERLAQDRIAELEAKVAAFESGKKQKAEQPKADKP